MGGKEIKRPVAAVDIQSVFGVSYKQMILNIEADGFGRLETAALCGTV
jgi:hypothetical protein